MNVRSARIYGALAAALAAAWLLVAQAPPTRAGTTSKIVIQYFVSPHPDDVFMAWALAQDSASNYPVFITLTKGESTGHCGQGTLAVEFWGSFDLSTPEGCKGARMASLNNWLDDQSDADGYLDDYVRAEDQGLGYNTTKSVESAPAGGTDSGAPTRSGMTGCRPAWGDADCAGANPNAGGQVPNNLNPGGGADVARQVTWYVGSTSARVEFDLGDGNLTDDEVVWALSYVRDSRQTKLPLTDEYGVVAAGFSNIAARYTACTDYSHHDHRAVHEAVYGTDLIPDPGIHPQWGATCGSHSATAGSVDPEALPANGGRANKITDLHYRENMATISSYFQRRFGWLHSSRWPNGPEPANGVIFAQWNYFWRRFA